MNNNRQVNAGKFLTTRVKVLLVAVVVGVAVLNAIAYWTIERIKVNGPLYREVSKQKSLIEDIAPPPLFVVESYLAARQLVFESREGNRRVVLEEKLLKLKEKFETRSAESENSLAPGPIRDALKKSNTSGRQLIAQIEGGIIPLVRDSQYEQAGALLNGEMATLYAQHCADVEEVMAAANANVGKIERESANLLASRYLLSLLVLFLSFSCIVVLAISRVSDSAKFAREGRVSKRITGAFGFDRCLFIKVRRVE